MLGKQKSFPLSLLAAQFFYRKVLTNVFVAQFASHIIIFLSAKALASHSRGPLIESQRGQDKKIRAHILQVLKAQFFK